MEKNYELEELERSEHKRLAARLLHEIKAATGLSNSDLASELHVNSALEDEINPSDTLISHYLNQKKPISYKRILTIAQIAIKKGWRSETAEHITKLDAFVCHAALIELSRGIKSLEKQIETASKEQCEEAISKLLELGWSTQMLFEFTYDCINKFKLATFFSQETTINEISGFENSIFNHPEQLKRLDIKDH